MRPTIEFTEDHELFREAARAGAPAVPSRVGMEGTEVVAARGLVVVGVWAL